MMVGIERSGEVFVRTELHTADPEWHWSRDGRRGKGALALANHPVLIHSSKGGRPK